MALTPRGDEFKPVVAIMESDGYDSADKMAKAIVKDVFSSLQMRETHVLSLYEAGRPTGLNYGPYATAKDAEKAAKLIGGSFEFRVTAIFGAGALDAHGTFREGGGFGFCTSNCGHAAWAHLMDGASRGKCAEPGCECVKFGKT